jgi:hypothetical protein
VLPTVASSGLSPAYGPAVIAIDKLSAIHVAYQQHYSTGRIPSRTVESASNASGSWVAASVGQGENVSQSIAAASAGGFHGAAVVELGIGRDTDLIYFGSAAAVLPKRVEPNILSTPAIAVAGGRVHIAHAALENVNFVYHHAMRVASAPESGAAAWDHDSIEVVATSAPSITVDAAGALHVAYLVQIDANGTFELHYAHRAPPDGIDQDCDGHGG